MGNDEQLNLNELLNLHVLYASCSTMYV